MRARRSLVTAALLVLTALVLHVGAASVEIPDASWILDHVRALSAPDMEGRQAGTPGAERAAEHVARAFRAAGLQAGGESATFRQTVSVPTGIKIGAPTRLTLVPGPAHALALGTDFAPLAVSESGTAEAEVVFAGYGITAPDLGYDDYAGLDVRGKVVLVLTREPRWQDPASPFRRPEAYHYSDRTHKLINARQHGARAVLVVTHPAASSEPLPALRGMSQPLGIMAAAVSQSAADTLLRGAGQSLAAAASAIDGALAPRSFLVPGARARVEIALIRDRGTTANVVGVLPGTDAQLRSEAIVIGAHYDHLGRGGEGSLAPDETGAVHHGADDNASGVAAVIALAQAFARAGGAPRTLVFAAFGAEEMGLLGSAHYVKQPAWRLDRTALMINLDMVGRLRENKLYVGGVDSGTGLRALVTDAGRDGGLTLDLRGDPFAPSDHTSFYAAGRPVLFLFTGAHPDYHRPSDTWDKINAPGLRSVTAFTARVIAAVAGAATAPAYVKVEATGSARPRGAYGAYFGVIPEFGERGAPGVAITGVRPGSPAERAGLQKGDVLVRFADVEVKTLEDLTFALRSRRAGDRVPLRFVRDGQTHDAEATLEERR
jgi:Zn-dependent M28 family amino/carboxypeptidase